MRAIMMLMLGLAMSTTVRAQGEAGARFDWLNECGLEQQVEVKAHDVEGAIVTGQLLDCDGSVRTLDYIGPAQFGVDRKAMSAQLVTGELAVSWQAPNRSIKQWGKALVVERQADAELIVGGVTVPSTWGWIRVTK